jgi:hypothetical protein
MVVYAHARSPPISQKIPPHPAQKFSGLFRVAPAFPFSRPLPGAHPLPPEQIPLPNMLIPRKNRSKSRMRRLAPRGIAGMDFTKASWRPESSICRRMNPQGSQIGSRGLNPPQASDPPDSSNTPHDPGRGRREPLITRDTRMISARPLPLRRPKMRLFFPPDFQPLIKSPGYRPIRPATDGIIDPSLQSPNTPNPANSPRPVKSAKSSMVPSIHINHSAPTS